MLILLCPQVTGRQLPAPELQYKSRKIVPQPDKGSWNMGDTGFYQPGTITSFAIACFEDRASLLQVNLNVPLRYCPAL